MASHLCGSFREHLNCHSRWMPCHIWRRLLSCVWPFMCLQMTIASECLVTFGAGKWLLTCVGPFMCLQITRVCKYLVTLGAGKWLLSCVHPFMCLQMVTPIKGLVTFGTGIGLLSSMDNFMFLQSATICKCLITCGAGKRLLSCVSPFMRLQIATLVGCLVTFGAGKWLLSWLVTIVICYLLRVMDTCASVRGVVHTGVTTKKYFPSQWHGLLGLLYCSLSFSYHDKKSLSSHHTRLVR